MPYLSPENGPPTAKSEAKNGVAESKLQDGVRVSASKSELMPETILTNLKEVNVEDILTSSYPIVKLEADRITDATAGRLATNLLGHVLFLKNQVPFPVMQLGRIPGGKTNTRAAKQRAELLASYDTISSHLDTTFSALSTALARCAGYDSKLAQAHLAILVGPSLTTAKSKLILGIDGLEPSIWETRVDAHISQQTARDKEEDDDDDDDDSDGDVEESDGSEEGPDNSEDGDSGEQDSAIEENGSENENEEDSESESESGKEDISNKSANEVRPLSPPSPYSSRAEEQRFLQNADRLLSRTLAAADADGNGISSELSPTQTHILVRAPRRFNHPAWLPRQNAATSLDTALKDFLINSGLETGDHEVNSRSKHVKKSKVEGVWITTRQGLRRPPILRETSPLAPDSAKDLEDDEMIWWSWDGKFQGFSDW